MQVPDLPAPRPGGVSPAARLAAALRRSSCIVAPETPDGLMARLVARAGFEVACVTVLGTALNRLGEADAGLACADEVVDNAARAIAASHLPTVVDIAEGFGNALNTRRTVLELARAGAAAVVLGDSAVPARQRGGRTLLAANEAAAKLRAAVDAAADAAAPARCDGPLVVARLDGAGSASESDLAARARLYRDAGIHALHVGEVGGGPTGEALAAVADRARALAGLPLVCTLGPGAQAGAVDLSACGIALALVPHLGIRAAAPAIEHVFGELGRTGTVGHLRPRIADFRLFTEVAGLAEVQALEQRYGVSDERRTAL